VPQPDGSYRVYGAKMFISGGEQDLTENIVHMVLARIKGAPPGAKGISLFIVPKFVPAADGSAGTRNDVALTGLLHKMGWRQTSSTALTFGGGEGATGFLLGQPHQGLAYMFQMMNEARIGVGLFASCIAYRGFLAALEYATHRPQGRLPSDKDPESPQVRLVQHADVRRLLLAQKAYAEGALAMCLYASSLFEDERTAPDETQRREAAQVLNLLTPVVKSWPSRYGTLANELAIQVFGGAGYTREYPVEQLYRDQRLNSIHEGAEAIHGLDLLGRKIARDRGQALEVLQRWMHQTVLKALRDKDLMHLAMSLAARQDALAGITKRLLFAIEARADATLANATVYLDVLGRITAAWLWLKQALAAQAGLAGPNAGLDGDFYRGKLQAARYYIEWELPAVDTLIPLLTNSVPYDMQEAWF
jgi:butyryl-CoA dehydrogenase